MNKALVTKIESVANIDKTQTYTGYYWMSDSNKPVIVNGKLEDHQNKDNSYPIKNPFTEIKNNPYIVEAHLYCRSEGYSISIKNTGEGAILSKIMIGEAMKEAKKCDAIELQDQCYLTHQMGNKKVYFKQAWIAEPDLNCGGEKDKTGKVLSEGMPVLQPAWRAFVGFEPYVEPVKMEG